MIKKNYVPSVNQVFSKNQVSSYALHVPSRDGAKDDTSNTIVIHAITTSLTER